MSYHGGENNSEIPKFGRQKEMPSKAIFYATNREVMKSEERRGGKENSM